ncbi:MAG: hypothetical protein ACLPKH_20995 [Rhodomicrobium sp.]
MKLLAVLGGKGGTTKTATAHLICLGAYLSGIPAAYALTDPLRKVRGEGRPYAVLDGRLPEQLALILNSSQNNLNGWLVIDGGGNRGNYNLDSADRLAYVVSQEVRRNGDVCTKQPHFPGCEHGPRMA